MEDFYKMEKVSSSLYKFSVTLPKDAFKKSYDDALAAELKNVDLKGFRKGNVPTDMLEKQLRPAIALDVVEKLAPYYLNAAVMKEEIVPVAPPKYSGFENLDPAKEVKFVAEVTVMPEFKLGNIKKVKPDTKNEGASEEDVKKTLDNMFENNKDKFKQKEINDEWAKEIAKEYKFKDISNLKDLKEVVKRVVESQKSAYIRQTQEAEIIRKAVKESKIEIPEAAVEYEAGEREHSFMHDLEHIKMSIEDFAKERNTTLEEMQEAWKTDAKEALENDVLFKIYADDKKIEITDEELQAEIDQIKLSNRGKENDNPELYENPGWQSYVKSYILKQKAYRVLIEEVLGKFEPINMEDLIERDIPEEEKADMKEGAKKDKKTDN